MPWELPALMEPDRLEAGLNGLNIFDHIDERIQGLDKASADIVGAESVLHAQISTLESSLYMRNQLLRDADWASMAHSVEVRTPLVDFELLKTCSASILNLNNSGSKSCLANSPQRPLPEKIQRRKKTGFTTPVNSWLKTSELLNGWKSVPLLRNEKCHWSRRHVYSVLKTYQHGFS
jgi:asparagine synthase (glutamine-hydrolysing)